VLRGEGFLDYECRINSKKELLIIYLPLSGFAQNKKVLTLKMQRPFVYYLATS